MSGSHCRILLALESSACTNQWTNLNATQISSTWSLSVSRTLFQEPPAPSTQQPPAPPDTTQAGTGKGPAAEALTKPTSSPPCVTNPAPAPRRRPTPNRRPQYLNPQLKHLWSAAVYPSRDNNSSSTARRGCLSWPECQSLPGPFPPNMPGWPWPAPVSHDKKRAILLGKSLNARKTHLKNLQDFQRSMLGTHRSSRNRNRTSTPVGDPFYT